MNCLVTGASGFIGRRLLQELLARGDAVHYLGRRKSPHVDSRAVYLPWEGGEPSIPQAPRFDAIIHLAGEPVSQRWNDEVKKRIYSSRVDGTRHLVAALRKLKQAPPVLVSASAVGYYGDRGDEVLTEESAPGTGFLADVCQAWEVEAVRAREFGMRVVPVRISTVLAQEGGALKQMLTPFRLGLGGKFGNGRQWVPWIDRDDIVGMLLFAAGNNSVTGVLNGSSPNPARNEDFTRELARALGRPAFLPVPGFAVRAVLGELGKFVLDSLRVVPEAAQQAGFRFAFPVLAASLRNCLRG